MPVSKTAAFAPFIAQESPVTRTKWTLTVREPM